MFFNVHFLVNLIFINPNTYHKFRRFFISSSLCIWTICTPTSHTRKFRIHTTPTGTFCTSVKLTAKYDSTDARKSVRQNSRIPAPQFLHPPCPYPTHPTICRRTLHPKFFPSRITHPTRSGQSPRSGIGSDWVYFWPTSAPCCIALTPYSPQLRQMTGVDASGATGGGESFFCADLIFPAGDGRKVREWVGRQNSGKPGNWGTENLGS